MLEAKVMGKPQE